MVPQGSRDAVTGPERAQQRADDLRKLGQILPWRSSSRPLPHDETPIWSRARLATVAPRRGTLEWNAPTAPGVNADPAAVVVARCATKEHGGKTP